MYFNWSINQSVPSEANFPTKELSNVNTGEKSIPLAGCMSVIITAEFHVIPPRDLQWHLWLEVTFIYAYSLTFPLNDKAPTTHMCTLYFLHYEEDMKFIQ